MAEVATDNSGGAVPEFQIGLAMAGAISAGAYTAGVIDFLFQALSEWEDKGLAGLAALVDDPQVAQARSGYPDTPTHRVKIAAVSGASAGGMTSAIMAAVAGKDIEPVTHVPPPDDANNTLYQSWVRRIDMTHFLQGTDIEANGGKVISLLDSTVLRKIAVEAVEGPGNGKQLSFVADPLRVFLTVANLNGVPYHIRLGGEGSAGHRMTMHADYMEFAVTRDRSKVPQTAAWLNPDSYGDPNWTLLADSALASGAFPGGLAPRHLTRPRQEYHDREWPVPVEDGTEYREIPPDDIFGGQGEVTFLNVDGGLMNNEPLELARRGLRAPGDTKRNPRGGLNADRAVIMIDPFPGAPFDRDKKVENGLLSVLVAMFGALKAEARFKPDELQLAANAGVYSRFMISPTRTPEGGGPEEYPIASGSLGGFGGFLCEEFRQHDFNLGRRNCQRFLMTHLLLPKENSIFNAWPDELKTAMVRPQPGNPDGPADHLPIVPLVGPAVDPVRWIDWPSFSQSQMETLKEGIGRRAKVVVKALLSDHVNWAVRTAAQPILVNKIVKKSMGAIEKSLADLKLRR